MTEFPKGIREDCFGVGAETNTRGAYAPRSSQKRKSAERIYLSALTPNLTVFDRGSWGYFMAIVKVMLPYFRLIRNT